MGANRFGLHRSLCGFAADRDRRPPFRALSVSQESHPSPRRAFCSPWPWKVCRFAPARSVLRSPGRPCRPSPFPKAWRAKPAMPYRPPGRTCALRARTARPSVVLCVLCDPLRPLWMKIHWQSFVYLRGPSCSSCQPRRAPLPHPSQRPHLCGKHAAPLKNTLQKGLYLIS